MTKLTFAAALLLVISCFSLSDAFLTSTEEVFCTIPSGEGSRASLQFITSQDHVAGLPGDFVMADYVSSSFKDAGIPSVEIFNLDVLLNYPSSPPTLTVKNPSGQITYTAPLTEDILDFDATSDTPWRNHTFHGYAPSGSVSAKAVYVNYGRPSDFDLLETAGINVEGKIVIVRYGQCFRGTKPSRSEAMSRECVNFASYCEELNDLRIKGNIN